MARRAAEEVPAEVEQPEPAEEQLEETVETQLPEGYTRVVSGLGAESLVPDTILETLLASGYTVK
jgi:hypothetical protein